MIGGEDSQGIHLSFSDCVRSFTVQALYKCCEAVMLSFPRGHWITYPCFWYNASWLNCCSSLALEDCQSRAIFTSVTIDSKCFHGILNRLTHLHEFNSKQRWWLSSKMGIIMLVPLVLWFKLVYLVGIQPLLGPVSFLVNTDYVSNRDLGGQSPNSHFQKRLKDSEA